MTDAGIPLIIYNAGGLAAADRLGAMNYIGSDDYKGGYAGGEYLATQGNLNGVCLNTLGFADATRNGHVNTWVETVSGGVVR